MSWFSNLVFRDTKGSLLTPDEGDANMRELEQSPNGKVFQKNPTKGIYLDPTTPLSGWHDNLGNLEVYGDAGDATRNTFLGGLKALQFDVSDSAFVDFHMPHDYLPGSDLYIHVHWWHNSATVTGGTTTWAFELSYCKPYDGNFSTPVIASVVDSAPTDATGQNRKRIAETVCSVAGGSGVALNTTDLEVDGVIMCRVYLDSNDMTDSVAVPDPYAVWVDIHYQSTGLPTYKRNKDSGDFYT